MRAGEQNSRQILTVLNPRLWSPEQPNLYHLRISLVRDKRVVDHLEQEVGMRSVEFVKGQGLFLNGKHRQIQGVCIHHDFGALGTAVNESALRYRLRL